MKKYFTSSQLKYIALIAMTIDHIAAYMFEIPIVLMYKQELRMLGRISAPIFLFVLIQSVRFTSSRVHLLIRLYIAGIILSISNQVYNIAFGNSLGEIRVGNMFPTLLYTAIYIVLIEKVLCNVTSNKCMALCYCSFAILVGIIPGWLQSWCLKFAEYFFNNSQYLRFTRELLRAILPDLLKVDYSIIFVVMGVCWYFCRKKSEYVGILLLFSGFCWFGTNFSYRLSDFMPGFFTGNQYLMCFSAPFIYLYNDKRGESSKYFFYIYYLIHVYVLMCIKQIILEMMIL